MAKIFKNLWWIVLILCLISLALSKKSGKKSGGKSGSKEKPHGGRSHYGGKSKHGGGSKSRHHRGKHQFNGLTCLLCDHATDWSQCHLRYHYCYGSATVCASLVETIPYQGTFISAGCAKPSQCSYINQLFCQGNSCSYCCTTSLCNNNGGIGPNPGPGQCPVGAKGERGSNGIPGQQGRPGLQGPKGDDGDMGPAGYPGPPSIPCPPGPPSPPGEKGQKGEPGTVGDSNIRKGYPGRPGRPGPPGRSGIPGIPGIAGPIGDPGSPGREGDCETCFNHGGCDKCDTIKSPVFSGMASKLSQSSENEGNVTLEDLYVNQDGVYDDAGHYFRAPRPGIYQFSVSSISEGSGAIPADLYHNGEIVASSGRHETGSIGPYPLGEFVILLELQVNDEVALKIKPKEGGIWDSVVGVFRSPSDLFFEGHFLSA